jgi:hypothetical protein
LEEFCGGRLYFATDSDVEKMLHGFSSDEVCRYHKEKGGVVCDQTRRYDAMCAHCGWNPRVARRRIKKFLEKNQERKENNAGDSV